MTSLPGDDAVAPAVADPVAAAGVGGHGTALPVVPEPGRDR